MAARRAPGTRTVAARLGVVGGLVVVLAAVLLVAAPAVAGAEVSPSSGRPDTKFVITFPAQPVELDLHIAGPGPCADLDPITIPISRAERGVFRFGPRVRGAGLRRNGTRRGRWCRGSYRARVVRRAEFGVDDAKLVSNDRFSVR